MRRRLFTAGRAPKDGPRRPAAPACVQWTDGGRSVMGRMDLRRPFDERGNVCTFFKGSHPFWGCPAVYAPLDPKGTTGLAQRLFLGYVARAAARRAWSRSQTTSRLAILPKRVMD